VASLFIGIPCSQIEAVYSVFENTLLLFPFLCLAEEEGRENYPARIVGLNMVEYWQRPRQHSSFDRILASCVVHRTVSCQIASLMDSLEEAEAECYKLEVAMVAATVRLSNGYRET
jgi:hypothetical protein